MRRTARISLLVEFDDKNFDDPDKELVLDMSNYTLFLDEQCQIIGEPTVEVDYAPRCALSNESMTQIVRRMEMGGSFAQAIGDAYARADSSNARKLEAEFWSLFMRFATTQDVPS